jgi:hypothetical protein
MIDEVKTTLGTKLFRVFVVVLGCLWIWHSFFSGVAEVGTAQNVTAQGASAALREPAIARGSVADAEIKEATAREALRRQKAEADEAEARACEKRMQLMAQNMTDDDLTPDHKIRPGSRLARQTELYNQDCDPSRKAQAKQWEMQASCRPFFEEWKSLQGHAAFAVSKEGGCGRSYKADKIEWARDLALEKCNGEPSNTQCKIIAER